MAEGVLCRVRRAAAQAGDCEGARRGVRRRFEELRSSESNQNEAPRPANQRGRGIVFRERLKRLQPSFRLQAPYSECFGPLLLSREAKEAPAGVAVTAPSRTICVALTVLSYRRPLASESGDRVAPFRDTPAKRPEVLE